MRMRAGTCLITGNIYLIGREREMLIAQLGDETKTELLKTEWANRTKT